MGRSSPVGVLRDRDGVYSRNGHRGSPLWFVFGCKLAGEVCQRLPTVASIIISSVADDSREFSYCVVGRSLSRLLILLLCAETARPAVPDLQSAILWTLLNLTCSSVPHVIRHGKGCSCSLQISFTFLG